MDNITIIECTQNWRDVYDRLIRHVGQQYTQCIQNKNYGIIITLSHCHNKYVLYNNAHSVVHKNNYCTVIVKTVEENHDCHNTS